MNSQVNFNQGPVGPAFWIFKEGYGDLAVAEVEERLRSGSREHSEMVEEGDSHVVPAVRVLLSSRLSWSGWLSSGMPISWGQALRPAFLHLGRGAVGQYI